VNTYSFLRRSLQNAQPARRAAPGAAGLVCLCLAGPALAQRVPITPANSQIGYTVFGLGLVPVHGAFQSFDGVAVLQSAHPLRCSIDVTIQVASLHMANPHRQQQALAPDMLAAGRYPTMHFTGSCQAAAIAGSLTMHGVSHPITLLLHRTSSGLSATATLRRQDFGITGLPHLVGSQVRLKLSTPAPDAFRLAVN
jgi:polyisoprenoid-binding protein YceI